MSVPSGQVRTGKFSSGKPQTKIPFLLGKPYFKKRYTKKATFFLFAFFVSKSFFLFEENRYPFPETKHDTRFSRRKLVFLMKKFGYKKRDGYIIYGLFISFFEIKNKKKIHSIMGQKVNPISLRLEKTNRHFDSCWYDDYNYTDLFLQDYKIKNYLKVVLNQITIPEGRVSIENLPKKTSINLFYHNPTSSRQKKNILFQLQNFKENKTKLQNSKKNKSFSFAEKNKYSVFCFPEQKYWTDKKRISFPLAQQGIEEMRNISSEIHKEGVTLSNEYKENKHNPSADLRPPFSDIFLTFQQKKPSIPSHTNKSCIHYCLPKANNNFNPFFLPTSFKRDTENNINGKLLEFVVNSRNYNKFEKRDIYEKWAMERFFVRYLYAQFYCKFLENKNRDNQEDAHTFSSLYMFLIFLKRYEKNPTKVTDFTAKGRSVSFPSQKTKRVSFKRTTNHKRFQSGLYSSKPSFKSHMESFLYNSEKSFFNINFFRALTEKQSALFLVQEIIHYLERKVPFRRIKTQILREIPRYKRIKGIRITCSGRVGGRSKKAQRSKTQSAKIGQTSLGVFSSKIDFACRSAYTRFGLIGVKVWICYQ